MDNQEIQESENLNKTSGALTSEEIMAFIDRMVYLDHLVLEFIYESIKSLIYSFLNSPTLFLEEKHLHNEFDRIVKLITPKNKQVGTTIDVDGYTFPLLMNEYATINRYKAKPEKKDEKGFQELYNGEQGNKSAEKGSPGSLDYVFLNPDWVSENNIFTCTNKNEKLRKKTRVEDKTNRYLLTIEFKYLHATKPHKSYDEKSEKIKKTTINTRLEKVKDEIIPDILKQINEGSPDIHAFYFNSDIPIPKDDGNGSEGQNIKNLLKAILKEEVIIKKLKPEQKIKIWYAQSGIKTRFKNEKDFYAICMSLEYGKSPEIIWEISKNQSINQKSFFDAIDDNDIGFVLGCLGKKGNKMIFMEEQEKEIDLDDPEDFLYIGHTMNFDEIPKIDINSFNTDGKTSLYLAVEKNHKRLVKALLNQAEGIDVNKGTMNRDFPIIRAIKIGNFQIAEDLLNHEKINLHLADYQGKTFLHHCAEKNMISLLDDLTKVTKDPDQFSQRYLENERNSLIQIISNKIILNQIDVNAVDGNGDTPLHIAGRKGNSKFYTLLIENGADTQFKNSNGEIPALIEKNEQT